MEFVGKSLDSGRAEALPVPAWARSNFRNGRVLDPLQMYAGSRLMAYGVAGAQGKRVWPWQRRKLARNANRIAQGRAFIYSPMGSGGMQ